MFSDGFKGKYTTIPFAIYKYSGDREQSLYSHYHKEVELIALIDGGARFFIGSEYYDLKSGDVLVIPPYSAHRALIDSHTKYDCICFDLSMLWDEALRHELEKGSLTVVSCLGEDNPNTECAYNCVISAINAYEKRKLGWEMETIGNLSVMFGRLYSSGFFVKSEKPNEEQPFVKSVTEYIEEHFSEQITSTTAAEKLYLNNSYFCRVFKNNFGCCFAEYLTSYRIAQAKMLLNMTEMSVSDIAIKCGFNDFSYFSKMFREMVGVTPSKYRRQENSSQ